MLHNMVFCFPYFSWFLHRLPFQEQIKNLGGVIRDQTTLKNVRKTKGDVELETSRGKFTAKSAVLCLGPWLKQFAAEQFGLRLRLEVGVES